MHREPFRDAVVQAATGYVLAGQNNEPIGPAYTRLKAAVDALCGAGWETRPAVVAAYDGRREEQAISAGATLEANAGLGAVRGPDLALDSAACGGFTGWQCRCGAVESDARLAAAGWVQVGAMWYCPKCGWK